MTVSLTFLFRPRISRRCMHAAFQTAASWKICSIGLEYCLTYSNLHLLLLYALTATSPFCRSLQCQACTFPKSREDPIFPLEPPYIPSIGLEDRLTCSGLHLMLLYARTDNFALFWRPSSLSRLFIPPLSYALTHSVPNSSTSNLRPTWDNPRSP